MEVEPWHDDCGGSPMGGSRHAPAIRDASVATRAVRRRDIAGISVARDEVHAPAHPNDLAATVI